MSDSPRVTTQSGAEYFLLWNGKSYDAVKDGKFVGRVVGAFPSNVPSLMSTTKVVRDGRFQQGYNANRRTFCFIASFLKVGMILVNRRGLRSSPIKQIVW
jgi:hypothetical protein